jgi:small ubiquitin-related modifier
MSYVLFAGCIRHRNAIIIIIYAIPHKLKLTISYTHSSQQSGEETFFKIKKTTKMSKVIASYASRKGIQPQSLRFHLDGERIKDDDTPEGLDLEDQDQIDCMLEQTGGM